MTEITPLFKRSDRVKLKKVGDSVALYVGHQKGIHVLNETALFVWEALKEPFTFDELLHMLTQAFEGNSVEMEEDLRELLNLFQRYDLVCAET